MNKMLTGKNIVMGITGGIAAWKLGFDDGRKNIWGVISGFAAE